MRIRELQLKEKQIFLDLNKFFTKNKYSFLYSPKIDDFCHIATTASKRYLEALAMIFANTHFVIKFLRIHKKETLFIWMSDHGGDESPFS